MLYKSSCMSINIFMYADSRLQYKRVVSWCLTFYAEFNRVINAVYHCVINVILGPEKVTKVLNSPVKLACFWNNVHSIRAQKTWVPWKTVLFSGTSHNFLGKLSKFLIWCLPREKKQIANLVIKLLHIQHKEKQQSWLSLCVGGVSETDPLLLSGMTCLAC